MSLLIQKNYKNNKKKSSRSKTQPKKSEKISIIDECNKLYHKYSVFPPTNLLDQLKDKNLKLFFDHLSIKDITIISQILSKFFSLKSIQMSPVDPEKPEETPSKRNYKPTFILQIEKKKKAKEKKMKHEKYKKMFNKIIYALSKHISESKEIISLLLNKIEFNEKYCQILSKGIAYNNSLQNLGITNSKLDLTSYEILLDSLLSQNLLSFLDLSNNNFGDKYGYMIARIISRHSQRRDQVIWFYSLRNELPPSNEYKKGLMFINLNGNNLSKDSAEYISSSLYSDQYIRAIYLNCNKFDSSSCKKFIYMMRKNLTILTIDLRNNPGYDEDIHHRLVIKMSKNIRYLFQQYKMKEYTEDEFVQLKEFIDISFFDEDIPQNIVEFYNDSLPRLSTFNNEKEENEEDNEEYKKIIKTEVEGNKTNKTKNKILFYQNNNITNNTVNTNYTNINSNILEENKKLFAENLKLKKQLIELKAKKLYSDKNNKNDIDVPNTKIQTESILEDDYNKMELLIKELNDLMNKIEERTAKIENDKRNDSKNKINSNKEGEIKKTKNTKDSKEKINKLTKNEDNKNINNKKENDKIEVKTTEKDNNDIKMSNIIKEEEKNINEDKKDNNLNIDKNKKLEVGQKENNNNIEENSDDDHFIDNEGNVYNLDDLTDEEKMVIIQQQLILQKLQEEAEARGEQFDAREFLEFLESQEKEEEKEQEINSKKRENKLNKSF